MLNRIIHSLLLRRHFWRYASFDEVAELYASRLLRVFAQRFVATFTSIFLLNEGFSLLYLCLFWAAFYFVKVLFSWPSAKIAAYFGPKHGTLYSNIIAAFSMVFLALVPMYGESALYLWFVLQAFAVTLYDLCYMVDFSKVKHADHSGKEIGFMSIIDKVSMGLSPLVGGLVATFFSPIAAMVLAAAMFLLSAWPLFFTKEPVRLKQKLTFKAYPWRLTRQSLVAEGAIGVDAFVTGTAWTLFLALIVFSGDGNELYAKIGILTSVTLFVSLVASYVFGRMIDKREGRLLLITSGVVNSIVHMFRPTVGSWTGAVANNAVNEVATTGYAMAFTQGMFDTADRSGFRIMYLFLIECAVNLGASIGALLLGLCCLIASGPDGFNVFFPIVGLITLLICFPRFMLYQK